MYIGTNGHVDDRRDRVMDRRVRLPGWQGEFGVDFSRFRIKGTSCANCRSLFSSGKTLHCMNPSFIAQEIPSQGKRAGDDRIPVESGRADKYCCNAWALSIRES